jgi:chromosome segregation ATPase
MTKKILEAQEDWKKLGFASKKVNNSLFARFRETCDKFFAMKAEYFKGMRESHANNLEKKIALCERAEALKDSTDWKKTADEIIELQKEWKTVGTVDKKHSDAVWKRFQEACDYFFDRRKKISSDTRKSEQANLKQKQEIVASLKNVAADTSREDVLALIKEANAKWQQVGHVPFKDKDKVYEAFRGAINELYDKFDIKESKLHMSNFVNTINEIANDENKLYRERERLVRAYEQKSGELKTYENNLGYFNVQSKSGSSLLREMERKISHLKDDIAALEEKIKLIDSKL